MNRDQKAAAIAEIAAHIRRVPGGLRRRLQGHLRAPGGRAARQAARVRRDLQGRQELAHRTRRRPGRGGDAEGAAAGPHGADVRARRRRHRGQGARRLRPRHPAAAVQGWADGRRRARPRPDPLDLPPALARSALRAARRRSWPRPSAASCARWARSSAGWPSRSARCARRRSPARSPRARRRPREEPASREAPARSRPAEPSAAAEEPARRTRRREAAARGARRRGGARRPKLSRSRTSRRKRRQPGGRLG